MNDPAHPSSIDACSLSHVFGGIAIELDGDLLQKAWKRVLATGVGCVAVGTAGAAIGYAKNGAGGVRNGFNTGCVLGGAAANALSSGAILPSVGGKKK